MAIEKVCELSRKEAVEAVKDFSQRGFVVMYKHGVWNKYYGESAEKVIEHIENSDWGADVDADHGNGVLYVCTPANADMW